MQNLFETADPKRGHAPRVNGYPRGKAFEQEVEAAAARRAGAAGSHQHRHVAAASEEGQMPRVHRHAQSFHHASRSFDAARNAIPAIHGRRGADYEEEVEADSPEIGEGFSDRRFVVLAASGSEKRPAKRFHSRSRHHGGLLENRVPRALDPGLEEPDPQGTECPDRDQRRQVGAKRVDLVPGKGERQDFQRRHHLAPIHPCPGREGGERHALAGRVQFVHPALVERSESRFHGIHPDPPTDRGRTGDAGSHESRRHGGRGSTLVEVSFFRAHHHHPINTGPA